MAEQKRNRAEEILRKLKSGWKASWRSSSEQGGCRHELVYDFHAKWVHSLERRALSEGPSIQLERPPFDANGFALRGSAATGDIIGWLMGRICRPDADRGEQLQQLEEGLLKRGDGDLLRVRSGRISWADPHGGWDLSYSNLPRLADSDEAVDPLPSNHRFNQIDQACGACQSHALSCVHSDPFEHITGKWHTYEFLCADCGSYSLFWFSN